MSNAHPHPWPRLSETLPGVARPDQCQAGGPVCTTPCDLTHWRECDEDDVPGPVVVTLCQPCADRIVEKHPRLYHQLGDNEPYPAAMLLCLDCRHRDGGECTHPDLKCRGGPGLEIVAPRPSRFHVCRSPRRLSGWVTTWPGPAKACAGREANETLLAPYPAPSAGPADSSCPCGAMLLSSGPACPFCGGHPRPGGVP